MHSKTNAFSDDVEINSFESVPEPESIPPDEEGDELMLSRMVAASKISSKVPGRNTFTKYNNSLNPLNSFYFSHPHLLILEPPRRC